MSGWISVKDRLPEEGTYCLVIVWLPEFSSRYYYIDRMRDGAFFMHGNREGEIITHWMPLPEPPEVQP